MTNRTVVQLFAYDEPNVITPTMNRYAETPVPDNWTFEYQAWVTPTEGHRTLRQAENHPAFKAFQAPQGKLTTRNKAHDWAFSRNYDFVITADADEPPLRDDYFAELLAPFQSGRVHAVSGWPKNTGLSAPLTGFARRLDETRRPLRANCSALDEMAWLSAGPFRTDDVDETEVGSVRREEEFDFRRRIEEIGEVVEQHSAMVEANNRRNLSKVYDALRPLGDTDLGHAASRQAETFAPHERRDDDERDR
jgi:hypothetical protein